MTSDPISQIKKLCSEIKRLVPPNKPRDPTGQFTTFMDNLKTQNIKTEDLDSIHRAYNYFNCLIEFQDTKPDTSQDKSKSIITSTLNPPPLSSLEPKPTLNQQKEMIEILLELGKTLKTP